MKRFLKPAHLIGLALVLALVAGLSIYWPWPFFALGLYAPDFHKMYVLPYVRDYQDLIAYLLPILMLSIAHSLWNWAKEKIDKNKGET